LGYYNRNTVNAQFIAGDSEYEVTNAITLQVSDVNKIRNSAQEWAPRPRGPLCFARAAQSIATPLFQRDVSP